MVTRATGWQRCDVSAAGNNKCWGILLEEIYGFGWFGFGIA